jgi:hypothetical protein
MGEANMTAGFASIGLLSFSGLRRAESNSVIRADATLTDQRPPWFEALARRFDSFVDLEMNWDSYGGLPVHESVAQAARDLILRIVPLSAPAPIAVPTSRGGIQFEWHTRDVELEIEVASPGRLSAVFENRMTGEEWERQFESDLSPLVEAIGQLPEST